MAATRNRENYRTWAPAFLTTLRNTGNIRASCQAAGISRFTAYATRRNYAKFKADWEEALEDACDVLEAAARKRALDTSDTLLIFLLKSHRSEVYGDKLKVTHEFVREQVRKLAAEQGLDADELIRVAEELTSGMR